MQRRGTVRFGARLSTIVIALLLATFGLTGHTMFGATAASAADPADAVAALPVVALPVVATPADDVPPAPPGTVSEFYPENANLSDCVGLVEKPGCGSESRGGWRQTLVFLALFAGLGVILWRVSRGISSNRRTVDSVIDARAGSDTGPDSA